MLRQEQRSGGVAWKCALNRSVLPRPPRSERVLQRFPSLQAGSAPVTSRAGAAAPEGWMSDSPAYFLIALSCDGEQ